MVAMPSASKPATMRAAVLYQAIQLGAPFKDALQENGVEVVYESTADRIDAQRIRNEDVQVFLINLDPELEEYLEEVTEMLDRFDRPVIFNDANSSATLSGWDQARWARHLAGKIRGELNSHPPRPADAPSIPMPPTQAHGQTPAKVTPEPAKSAPVPLAAVSAPASSASPTPISADPFDDLDVLLGAIGGNRDSSPKPAPPSSVDLDDLFNTLGAPKAGTPAATANLDALLGVLEAKSAPLSTTAPASELETLSFDNLDFSMPSGRSINAELTDLDALFQQLESKPPEPVPAVPATTHAVPVSVTKPTIAAEKKEAPSHWSLTPLDDPAAAAKTIAPAPVGRAQFKIDEPVSKAPATPAKVTPKTAGAENELPSLDFELGDFMTDPAPAPPTSRAPATPPAPAPKPAPAASASPARMQTPAPKPAAARNDNFPDLGLSADEFEALGFDTITLPAGKGDTKTDPDPLADLDDIFAELDAPPAPPAPAPAPAPPARTPAGASAAGNRSTSASVSLPDLNRIFVLGASIGGPEAVRSFLAGMKPGIGAGFVLAQHMGAEFIELMAAQLDKSSPVRVRVPIEGERFRHGQVIVVPVGKRLTVTPAGEVAMGAPTADSPYSPSIDRVLMDMADRFGSRCTAIVFSGMASDAVEGCKYLHARGGHIWVQDPNTCVISSMIDGAQAAGIVSFVGSPEALAQKVLKEVL